MATGNSGTTFTSSWVWRERQEEGERERVRHKVAYCFPILCLQRMIMDIQYWWHIFMMDGTAKAGDYPAGIVRSLIK